MPEDMIMSLRVLHAADLHLDSPMRGLARYETAPRETLQRATRQAFTKLVDDALAQGDRLVLLAGDLFDGDWQDFNVALFFAREVGRLTAAGIPVVLIRGNHDAESKLTKSLTLPEGVHIMPADKPETVRFPDLGIAVHGQSYGRPDERRNLAVGYPSPLAGWLNIGLLHTGLEGHSGHAAYAPCTLKDLVDRGYDYWALGHVHLPEVLCGDPWIVYAGCLQGRHINEPGAHGAFRLTIAEGRITAVDRLAFDVARWHRVTADVADDDSVGQAVERAIGAALPDDDRLALVRLTLACATAPPPMPEWLAEVRAAADRVRPGRIWIERVDVDVTVAAAPAMAVDSGALERLLDLVRQAPEDAEIRARYAAEIDAVAHKLPRRHLQEQLRDRLGELDSGPLVQAALADLAQRLRKLGS